MLTQSDLIIVDWTVEIKKKKNYKFLRGQQNKIVHTEEEAVCEYKPEKGILQVYWKLEASFTYCYGEGHSLELI